MSTIPLHGEMDRPPPVDEFFCFQNLPLELRRKVWWHTIPEQCIVYGYGLYNHGIRFLGQKCAEHSGPSTRPMPSLFVNLESYLETLKYVKIITVKGHRTPSCFLDYRFPVVPSRDLYLISALTFTKSAFHDIFLADIKQLNDQFRYSELDRNLLIACPNKILGNRVAQRRLVEAIASFKHLSMIYLDSTIAKNCSCFTPDIEDHKEQSYLEMGIPRALSSELEKEMGRKITLRMIPWSCPPHFLHPATVCARRRGARRRKAKRSRRLEYDRKLQATALESFVWIRNWAWLWTWVMIYVPLLLRVLSRLAWFLVTVEGVWTTICIFMPHAVRAARLTTGTRDGRFHFAIRSFELRVVCLSELLSQFEVIRHETLK